MPQDLVDAGFLDLTHFWEPWCVATVDGKIAALAFAVRLGQQGAELGVNTLPAYRSRGLAAAVTAGWSAHPALQTRPLFYGTHRDNLSSQRVIARLGLPFLGIRLQI
jgi:predicted GNAT family acetyltransferase